MAGPAFKRSGSRFSGSGNYGTSTYGTSPYGGTGYPPFLLPDPIFSSDDLTASRRRRVAELVHTREGLILQSRKLGTKGRWTILFSGITAAEVNSLAVFFEARTFRLLPDAADETNYWEVKWAERDFEPKRLRDALHYELLFTVQEV